MKLKGIVLDLDGTITRFNLDFIGARRKALEELDKMGLRTPDMTEELSLYLILKKMKDKLAPDSFANLRGTFYTLLEEMEVKAAEEATLQPGAIETLRKLRGLGLKIGVVTNNGRTGTEMTLKRCGLTGLFDALVTRDDCEEMKPDGAPVRKVLNEMGVTPEEAILVGDGIIDIMAARQVGLPSVAVATGPVTSGRLLQAEPDYFLGFISDLPLLVEKLESCPS